MEYIFDPIRPPLLKDFPDIRNVSSESLARFIGFDSYDDDVKEKTGEEGPDWQKVLLRKISKITVSREQRWSIYDGPLHYAEDTKYSRSVRRGYTQEQKSSFEKTIEFEAGYGVEKIFKFNASVRGSLKIGDDITKTWVVEETKETEQTLKAGTTYVFWYLHDTFKAVRDTKFELYIEGKRLGTKPPERSESTFSNIINYYEDFKKDPNMNRVNTFLKHGYNSLA